MSKSKSPRVQKSKKDIVSDIQLVQAAQRRRSLIKDIIFPYLLELDDTVGYSKIFIQSFSGLVNGEFDKTRNTTTVGQIRESLNVELDRLFLSKGADMRKERDRYLGLLDKLSDISIQDLTYAAELPRYIDGYLTKDKNKESIKSVDIDAILGK